MHFFLSLLYVADASGNENKPWHGQQHEGVATVLYFDPVGSHETEKTFKFPPDYGWFRAAMYLRQVSLYFGLKIFINTAHTLIARRTTAVMEYTVV